MIVRFQISTRWSGRKRTIQVIVHDTAADLQAAGDKHNASIGSDEKVGSEAVGLSQGLYREALVDGEWVLRDDAGIIRLVHGMTTTGVISHEATHMACSIYDNDCRDQGDPIGDMEPQETLAYLVGDITSKIVNKLYEKGVL